MIFLKSLTQAYSERFTQFVDQVIPKKLQDIFKGKYSHRKLF